MKRYVVLDKKVGETPLEALTLWKKEHPEYRDVPASYAGRLDPMASGKLLVLLGEECRRQEKYTKLDKEYDIEVLLDFASDTGDVLGIPEYSSKETRVNPEVLRSVLRKEEGAHMRKYPAFSSKTVAGKSLFLYMLEGTIGEIEIPEHVERIHRIRELGVETVGSSELEQRIGGLLSRVPRSEDASKALGADFRQDEIRDRWRTLFEQVPAREFLVLRLRVACASGTYMRSLAGRIGEALGTKGLALSIHRRKIGTYWLSAWLRTY